MVTLELAPKKAIDLLERIEKLEEEVRQLRDDLNISIGAYAALKSEVEGDKIEDHKLIHEAQRNKNSAISERLEALESIMDLTPEPRRKQKDQGDILRLLLATHDGKMPLIDARMKLGLSEAQFSQLLSTLKGEIESKPMPLNKRKRYVILIKGGE